MTVGSLLWVPPVHLASTPPADARMRAFAKDSFDAPLSVYPMGCIESQSFPKGWFVNTKEVRLGLGRTTFLRGVASLEELKCMHHPWLRVYEDHGMLIVCARQFGFVWLMNANRMLPRVRSPTSTMVGWQCTQKHVLAGEEQLRVMWDRESDAVTFRVLSYSRPRHPLAVLALPVVLLQQRRFASDAARLMQAAAANPVS